jgi:putative acetyltransferase
MVISLDSPLASDVRNLLEIHLSFSHEMTPSEHVHALEVERLLDPSISFFSGRKNGVLLGIGALKRLDDDHAEIKSMHTAKAARRQGVAREMVDHILHVAVTQGYKRVSLETGTMDAYAPARSLYERVGFTPCAPYGEYTVNPYSVCMTTELTTGWSH